MKKITFLIVLFLISCGRNGFNEYLDGIAVICGTTDDLNVSLGCATASTIDSDGTLTTNEHVISAILEDKRRKHITIRYFVDEEPKLHVDVIKSYTSFPDFDVSFLEVIIPGYEHYPYEQCDRMKLFDDIVVVSAHNDDRRDDKQTSGVLDFAAGNVIHIYHGIFTANISTEPGFSGAPVFASRGDDYSCMVGMHRGHREVAGVPYSYGIGVRKIRYLYGIYKNGASPGGGVDSGIKYQIR